MKNEMKVTLDDHSAEVLSALESACQRALETCGLVAEETAPVNLELAHCATASLIQ